MTHMPGEQDGSIELEQPEQISALDVGDDDPDALAGVVKVYDDDPALPEADDSE